MIKLVEYFKKYRDQLDESYPVDEIEEDVGERDVRLYAYYILGEEDVEKIEASITEISADFKTVGVFDNEYENCVEIVLPVEKPLASNALCGIYNDLKKIVKGTMTGKLGGNLNTLLDNSEIVREQEAKTRFRIVFLVKKSEANLARKKEIIETVEAEQDKNNYRVHIYFQEDLLDRIEELNAGPYVEEGVIHVDANNRLIYEDSLVVNLRASSLQQLYRNYKNKGLFEQNLRYHVRGDNVDEAISKSAKNDKDNFWYFNNGISIVCEDYSFRSENEIELKKFSIINGCQTTSVLGKLNSFGEDDDFLVLCKIVRVSFECDPGLGFVSSLAAAANQQKPIKDSDLIANKPNQRALTHFLADSGIFYEVKRGQKIPQKLQNIVKNEKWAKTKSTELGTLILSAIGQKPGSARTSKDNVFNKKNQPLIFGVDNAKTPKFKINLYKDLLLLRSFYEDWKNRKFWEEEKSDKEKNAARDGLLKNGMCEMVATFVAFAKCVSGENAFLICTDKKTPEEDDTNISNLSKWDDFSDGIFNRPTATSADREKLQRECFLVFDRLMDYCILPAFKEACIADPQMVPSNFLKSDRYHRQVLIKLLRHKDEELAPITRFFEGGLEVCALSAEERVRVELLHLRFKMSTSKKTKNKARKCMFSNSQAESIANTGRAILSKPNGKSRFEDYLLNKLEFLPSQCEFWSQAMLKVMKKYF